MTDKTQKPRKPSDFLEQGSLFDPYNVQNHKLLKALVAYFDWKEEQSEKSNG